MCLVVPVHVLYFISKQTLAAFVLKEAKDDILWCYHSNETYLVGLLQQGKDTHETKAQTAGAYPGFLSMRHG